MDSGTLQATVKRLRSIKGYPIGNADLDRSVCEVMAENCHGGVRFGVRYTPAAQVTLIGKLAPMEIRYWSLEEFARWIDGAFSPYPRV